MKNFLFSAGLVAVGAAGIQNAMAAPDLISPKAWNVSGTLRGFYDDNYTVSGTKKGSFGVEASPSVSLNVPLQQTDFGIRYTYGVYYYEQRDEMSLNPIDQTHQFDLWLDHAFNERWKLNVTDTFAVGQEPELLGATTSQPFRVEGDNIANHANIVLDTQWTRLFSTSIHYGNNFYDYDNSGATVGPIASPGLFFPNGSPLPTPVSHVGTPGSQAMTSGPSLAGLLNRIEQNAGIDFQWKIQPETMVFIGYNFSMVNYTGNEPIAAANYISSFTPGSVNVGNPPVSIAGNFANYQSIIYHSEDRNSYTHYGYAGVSHEFTANITGTVRAGVSYTDSYNDPLQQSTSLSPYADLSVTYTYIPGSYVQLGFTHDINSTDVVQPDANGSITQFQESSVVYVDVNHRFNPKLLGTVIGRYQMSDFQGGQNNNESDDTISVGVNLSYQFTQHFSADIGYNFDDMESPIAGRGYTRNRVYIGLGANY